MATLGSPSRLILSRAFDGAVVSTFVSAVVSTFVSAVASTFACVLAGALVCAAAFAPRASAQSISWTGAGDGTSWSDVQNWNPARAPLATDDVAITLAGTYTVSLSNHTTVNSLTLGGAAGTQSLSNAGLALASTTSIIIESSGELLWFGHNLLAAAITNRGTVRMTGATNKAVLNATFENEGLLVYDEGNLYLGTGVEIDNSGTFDIAADVVLRRTGVGPQTLRNRSQGTIIKSAGGGYASLDVAVVNEAGSVDVSAGTLLLDEGGEHAGGTYYAANDAALLFNIGVHVLSGTLSGEPDGIIGLTGSTLVASESSGGSLDFSGSGFQWFTGNVGSDTTQTLVNKGLMLVTGGGSRIVGPGVLRNEGTLRYDEGMFFVSTSATIDNHGVFDIAADVNLSRTGLPPQTLRIASTGTLRKSGGALPAVSQILTPVVSEGGTIAVDAGALSLRGGGTLTGGRYLPAAGTQLRFESGTFLAEGLLSEELEGDLYLLSSTLGAGPAGATLDFSGTGFQFISGILGGPGTLVNTGDIHAHTTAAKIVRSDSLRNEGSFLASEAYITVDASRIRNDGHMEWNALGYTFQQSNLTNRGTISWTRGAVLMIESEIRNEGLFNQRVDANLSSGGTVASRFVNHGGGRFVRSEAAGGSLISLAFTNEPGASVEAESGILYFLNAFDHQPGARLQGSGGVDFARSGFTNGGITLPGTQAETQPATVPAILPGSTPGPSPGRLYYTGTYAPSDGAVLRADIAGLQAGTQYDQLDIYATRYLVGGRYVGGNAILGGGLEVTLDDTFVPQPGDAFTIVRVEHGITGGYSSRSGLISGNVALYPAIDDTSYTLVAAAGVPTLTGNISVDPVTVVGDQMREVTVSGNGFPPDVQVRLECVQCDLSDENIAGLVGSISPTEMAVSFDLRSGDRLGTYRIVVDDPRGGEASADFSITPGLPVVSVEAGTAEMVEGGTTPGFFRVRANRPLFGGLEIPVQFTGTATWLRDYVADVMGSTIRIETSQQEVPIVVLPLSDGVPEANETVTVSVQVGADYVVGTASATAAIIDGVAPADFAIYAATPLRGGNTGPVTITAHGQGIGESATMRLVGGGGPIAPIYTVIDPDGIALRATFDLAGEAVGTRQIEVESGGQTITFASSFTIEEGRTPHVLIDLSLPPAVARLRNNRVTLTLTNVGNIDAVGVPALELPANATWTIDLPGTELPDGALRSWDETVQPVASEFGVVLPLMPARIPPGGSQVIPLRLILPSTGDAQFRPIWIGN